MKLIPSIFSVVRKINKYDRETKVNKKEKFDTNYTTHAQSLSESL